MERQAVQSKMIAAIGYDEASSTLSIEFCPRIKKDQTVVLGAIWEYFNVPKDLAQRFQSSESYGKFFLANIKEKFECKRVERENE